MNPYAPRPYAPPRPRLIRIPGVYLGALGRPNDDVEDVDDENPRERRGTTLHFDSATDARKGILIRHIVDVSPSVQASADQALAVADRAVTAATKATSSFSVVPIVLAGIGGLVVGAVLTAAWNRTNRPRARYVEQRDQ